MGKKHENKNEEEEVKEVGNSNDIILKIIRMT